MKMILDTGNTSYEMVGNHETFAAISLFIENGESFELEYNSVQRPEKFLVRVGSVRAKNCTILLALGESDD